MKQTRCLLSILFLLLVCGAVQSQDWTEDQQKTLDEIDQSLKTDERLNRCEQIVYALPADSPIRSEIEKRILGAIPDAKPEVQRHLCELLFPLGTNQSAAVLESLLSSSDSLLAQYARYALERLPGAEADAAFLRALDKATGASQAGIAAALGNRNVSAAADKLAALTKSADKTVAKSAVFALGTLGLQSGLEPLKAAQKDKELAVHANEALLKTAEKLAAGADSDRNAAVEIYNSFKKPEAGELYWAALSGLVRMGQDVETVFDLLTSTDDVKSMRALSIIEPVQDPVVLERLAKYSLTIKPRSQVNLLGILALKSSDQLVKTRLNVEQVLDTAAEPEVKTAAITVLGIIGSADSLPVLLKSGESENAAVLSALEAALTQIKGIDLASVLTKFITDANQPTALRCSAIRVLTQRQIGNSARTLALLVKLVAESKDDTIQSAALAGAISAGRFCDDPKAVIVRLVKTAPDPTLQKKYLDALAENWSSFDGLDTAIEIMRTVPAVRPNAGLSAVRIGNSLRGVDAQRVADAMQIVVKEVKHADVEKRAQSVNGEIDKYVGYIQTWSFNGPYQKDGIRGSQLFNMDFGPEKEGAVKTDNLEWKPLENGFRRWVWNLEQGVENLDNGVVYLRTFVYSPTEQKILFDGAADDGMKIWINGIKVHEKYTPAPPAVGSHQAKSALKAGWNELVVKVVDETGGWEFALRIRNRFMEEIDGLKYQIEKP